MNSFYDNHFNREVKTIYPGEFYSSSGPEMISTVLGSCISIALFDPENKIGGLNHFMLAKDNSIKDEQESDRLMGRFGEYAMQLLIDDVVKKGAERKNLQAKVFGGSNVFNLPANTGAQVGEVNSRFAFDYLNQVGIPVIKSDTGGIYPRKIFFDPTNGKVFRKFVQNSNADNQQLAKEEESYLKKININIKAVKNLFPEDEDLEKL